MRRTTLTLFFTMTLLVGMMGQNQPAPAGTLGEPKNDALEIGLHAGHFFSNGNIKFTPGYAAGIHVRRALDHVFSLRLDLMYGQAKGEDDGARRSFDTNWTSGSLQVIASLNNLKWNLGERKHNFYVLGGFGLNGFSVDKTGEGGDFSATADVATHGELGLGLAFRINERVNFGIEHKGIFVFGKRADWLDGVESIQPVDDRRYLRDVGNYTSARLNINIGNMTEQSEPLYWLNPMEEMIATVNILKDTRVALVDTDGDGVIDQMDDEQNTVAGAYVDARGVTLDSDSDGVPNHLDQEPFSRPGYQVDANGVAQVPDVEADLRRYVDERLRNFQPTNSTAPNPTTGSGGISAVYLPNLYFATGGATVSRQHLSTLGSVATALKSDPALRLVITGYTDPSGNEAANQRLSYQRAKNTIDQLVEKFGIDRSRLVLQYRGETQLLLPSVAEVNRRVEFSMAKGQTDMAPPASDQ